MILIHLMTLCMWAQQAQLNLTAQPIDVPAIQEPYSSRPEVKESEVCPFPIEGRWVSECKDLTTGVNRQVRQYNDLINSLRSFTTCADKSRILMHSEDGKYWCHKPQTEAPACGPAIIWPMDDLSDAAKQEVWMCLPNIGDKK